MGHGSTLLVGVENLLDARGIEVRASGFVAPGAPRRLIATWRKEL